MSKDDIITNVSDCAYNNANSFVSNSSNSVDSCGTVSKCDNTPTESARLDF